MSIVPVKRGIWRVPVAVKRGTVATDPGGDPGDPGGSGDPSQAFDVLANVQPAGLFARWNGTTGLRVEGQSWRVRIVLNRPVAIPSVALIVADAASTVDLAQVSFPAEVEFGFGDTEKEIVITTTATAANAGTQTLVLKIDPEAATASSLTVIDTQPAFGPDTATLTIIDSTPASTPTWTLVPASATTPEGVGALTYAVELDVPAVDDVEVDIGVGAATTATLSTGPGNGDFQAFGQIVTIPEGQQSATFEIVYVDNAADVAVDPVLEVTGEIQNGTVTNPAGQSWTTTIEDNDVTSAGPPRVRFFTSAIARQAGSTVTVTAQLRDADGNPTSFIGRTPVPVTRTLSAGVTGNEFTAIWGSNDPNTVTFEPQQSSTSFQVEIDEGVAAGEFVRYEIQSSPTNVWTPGTVSGVTLTVTAAEATILMVPSMEGGSRRMVQGQFAVDPPSLTIPELSLGTGERVQCVGQKKDASGQWISGYFYGLTSGNESVPGTGSETELRLADVDDVTPAESGTFSPAFAPTVSFDVNAANVALPYECSTALANGDKIIRWTQPENLGGFDPAFPQVGPDLVRERVYSMRPVLQGVTPANGLTSGDALGLVEVCETRIAGESNVFLFEGRWFNGAWDKTIAPEVTNPMVDGEVYLRSLAASVEAGWEIRFGTASALQTGDETASVELLQERTEDYLSTVCSSYTFRFAVVTAGDADARLRADGYLAERNIATAIGPLGPTRKGISGEASEPILDWERAGLSANGLNGWRAVKSLGDAYGARVQASWAAGSGELGQRVSWLLAIGTPNSGGGGGDLIDGSNNTLPWWGQWLRARYALHSTAGRNNLGYRDVETGDAAWWWNVQRDVGGVPTMPFLGSFASAKGSRRHWHFNNANNTSNGDLYNPDNPDDFRLAPTSRPWNTPEVEDPEGSSLWGTVPGDTSWEAEIVTHFARLRLGVDQTWESMRSWLAYRVREEICAYLSRVMAPVPATNVRPNQFEIENYSIHAANAYMGAVERVNYRNLGLYATSNFQNQAQGFNLRAWGWASYFLQGFYSLATDDLREKMRGQGGVPNGRSLLGEIWQFFELVVTPAGMGFRGYDDNPRPNPYLHTGRGATRNPPVDDAFEAADYVSRSGGLPHLDVNPDGASAAEHFHQMFFQHAIEPWKRHVWGSFAPQRNRLDNVLRYHDNVIQGQRVLGAGGRDLSLSYMLICSLGPVPRARGPQADTIDNFTEAQVRAGEAAWRCIAIGGAEDVGWSNHFQKSGWTALAAARGLEDDSMLYIAKDVWGRQDDTDEEFVNHVMANGLQQGATKTSPFGEWTFMVPYIATLVNRYS